MADNRRRYNRGNYSRQTYNRQNDYNDRMKPWWKRINKGAVLVIFLAILLLGGTFYYTGGFYSDHLMSWETKKAWFCPYDYKVYEENDNALVTKDNFELNKTGKELTIKLNAANIDVEDRIYVMYTVLYYSGDSCVYQTESVSAVYDTLGGQDPEIELFKVSDVDEHGPYYAKTDTGVFDTSKELTVDSVRVAVLYNNEGKNISFLQKIAFTEAIMIDYVVSE